MRPPETRRPTKVLIVDDEADIRKIAEFALTRLGGMDVVEAVSAEEAVEVAAREQPDIILMDYMMPGTDGAEAVAALQRQPTTRHIPVVFLTAKAALGNPSTLRMLGARGVLLKPFDPLTLAERLRKILLQTAVERS